MAPRVAGTKTHRPRRPRRTPLLPPVVGGTTAGASEPRFPSFGRRGTLFFPPLAKGGPGGVGLIATRYLRRGLRSGPAMRNHVNRRQCNEPRASQRSPTARSSSTMAKTCSTLWNASSRRPGAPAIHQRTRRPAHRRFATTQHQQAGRHGPHPHQQERPTRAGLRCGPAPPCQTSPESNTMSRSRIAPAAEQTRSRTHLRYLRAKLHLR